MVESEVDKLEDGDSDLEFSVVYFLIGGFDWRDWDELLLLCESFYFVVLFLIFDVVEMIELCYNNVVWLEVFCDIMIVMV